MARLWFGTFFCLSNFKKKINQSTERTENQFLDFFLNDTFCWNNISKEKLITLIYTSLSIFFRFLFPKRQTSNRCSWAIIGDSPVNKMMKNSWISSVLNTAGSYFDKYIQFIIDEEYINP